MCVHIKKVEEIKLQWSKKIRADKQMVTLIHGKK